MKRLLILLLAGSSALSACNLAPVHVRPDPLVPTTFPTGPAYAAASGEAMAGPPGGFCSRTPVCRP